MVPTQRALEIASRLSTLINEFREIVEPDNFDPATAQATILISSPDAMLNMPAPFIARWAQAAPGIKPAFLPLDRLSKPDIDSRMATGQLDLLMTLRSIVPERLHMRSVMTESFVCAMRADHPFNKRIMSIDDLCGMKHLIVSPQGGEFSNALDRALAEHGKERNVVASLPGFMFSKQILLNSDFAAVFPRSIALSFKGALKLYELPVPMPTGEVVLGWHERTHRSAPHRWFREQLFEMFRQSAVADETAQAVPGALIRQAK
jgi:DNA-binding transcriptional LysR family regulator